MNLDTRTIVFVTILGTLLMGGGLLSVTRGQLGQIRGLKRWAFATFVQAAGWVVTGALRGVIPTVVSLSVGNTLILLALASYLFILAEFTDTQVRRWWVFGLIGTYAVLIAWLTQVHADSSFRQVMICLCVAVIMLRSAHVVLTGSERSVASHRFIGGIYAAGGVFLLGRAAIYVVDKPVPQQPSLFPTTILNDVTFLVFFVMGMLLTFGFLLMCHDRFARQQQESESALRSATLAAEAASQAKSDFLATMSHEIRTPMNGVLGFTELLLETPLSDEQRAFTATIQHSGQALLTIINDILDFSKVEAGKVTFESIPFDAPILVRDIVDLMASIAPERDIAITADYPDSLPRHLLGDPGRVRQVLLNFVSNAVKFTDRGSVHVAASEVAAIGGRLVRIEVRDTGIGIPEDKLASLFREFTQADSSTTRRYGGTGLGLAISRRLVQLMGGEVGVTSEVGVGSVFWFTLPLAEAPVTMQVCPGDSPAAGRAPGGFAPVAVSVVAPIEQAAAVAAASAGPAVMHPQAVPDSLHLRVLVAEDGPVNQLLVMRVLANLGCNADLAVNGRQAVEQFEDNRYDVVLMDCHMPELDGFEATAAIREIESKRGTARRVPIVALTASATEDDKGRCLSAGMTDFCSKPFTSAELLAVLRRCAGAPVAPAPLTGREQAA